MREQLTPRQKKLAAGLGAVGLLALVYVWQADDENALLLAETAGSGQQTVSAGKEAGTSSSAESDKAKYQKIRGLESQTSLEELRNPFSPAHEKRGEAAAAEKHTKADGRKTQLQVRENIKRPDGQTSATAAGQQAEYPSSLPETAEKEAVPQLQLRGIVQGGSEPLVILSDGRQSSSLSVGESFAGHEVVAIGAQGVKLSGPDGEKWLPMASLD